MNCPECEEHLQRCLDDGDVLATDAELSQHLEQCASCRALSGVGRRQHIRATACAVAGSDVPVADSRARPQASARSWSCPNHARRAASFSASSVSSGRAADTVARCTRASWVRPAAISRSAAACAVRIFCSGGGRSLRENWAAKSSLAARAAS